MKLLNILKPKTLDIDIVKKIINERNINSITSIEDVTKCCYQFSDDIVALGKNRKLSFDNLQQVVKCYAPNADIVIKNADDNHSFTSGRYELFIENGKLKNILKCNLKNAHKNGKKEVEKRCSVIHEFFHLLSFNLVKQFNELVTKPNNSESKKLFEKLQYFIYESAVDSSTTTVVHNGLLKKQLKEKFNMKNESKKIIKDLMLYIENEKGAYKVEMDLYKKTKGKKYVFVSDVYAMHDNFNKVLGEILKEKT